MLNPPSGEDIEGTTSAGGERAEKELVERVVADQRRSTCMRGGGSICSNASSGSSSSSKSSRSSSSESDGPDEDSSSAATISDTADDEDENDDIGDEELEQARKAIEEYKKQRAEAKSAAQGSVKGSKELMRRERRRAMESDEIIKTSNVSAFALPSPPQVKNGGSPSFSSAGEEQRTTIPTTSTDATSFFHSLAGLLPPCQKFSDFSEFSKQHQQSRPPYRAPAVRPFALRSVFSVTNVTSALPTTSIATHKGPNAVHCSSLSGDLMSSGGNGGAGTSNKKTGGGSSRINSATATTSGLSALPSFSSPFVNSGGKRFVEAPSRSVGGDGTSSLLLMTDTSSLNADLTQMQFQYFRNDDPLLLSSLLSNAVLFRKLVSSVRKFSKAAEAADKESAVHESNILQRAGLQEQRTNEERKEGEPIIDQIKINTNTPLTSESSLHHVRNINRSSIVDRVIHDALTETMMITKPRDHVVLISEKQRHSRTSSEAEAHRQPPDGDQNGIQSRIPSAVSSLSFLSARPLFSGVASCYLAPPPARSDKGHIQDIKNKRNLDRRVDVGSDNRNEEQANLAVSPASALFPSSSSAARGPSLPHSVVSTENSLRYAFVSRDRVVGRKRTVREEGANDMRRYDLYDSMTNDIFYEDTSNDDDGEERDRKRRAPKAVDRAPNREEGEKKDGTIHTNSYDMERRKIIFGDFLRDDTNDEGRSKVGVDESDSLLPSYDKKIASKVVSTSDNFSGGEHHCADASSSASLATDVGIVSAIAASVTTNSNMCGTRPAEASMRRFGSAAKSSNTTLQETPSAGPTAIGGGTGANAIGTFLEKGDFVAKAQWAEYQHELFVERKNKEAAERAAQRRSKSNRR